MTMFPSRAFRTALWVISGATIILGLVLTVMSLLRFGISLAAGLAVLGIGITIVVLLRA